MNNDNNRHEKIPSFNINGTSLQEKLNAIGDLYEDGEDINLLQGDHSQTTSKTNYVCS